MNDSAQTTSNLFMVKPANFSYNEETAGDNAFQRDDSQLSKADIQKLALIEFRNVVEELRSRGLTIVVGEDSDEPIKPDAIFPNNWITTHQDGSLITYPMYAENRRMEREERYIELLSEKFEVSRRYSFEQYELNSLFLEGTGSMILDRINKVVYACLSARTDVEVLDKFCVLKGYEKVVFHSTDKNGKQIYHTNVMMSVGRDFAVICLDTIRDEEERKMLEEKLRETGKEIIEISEDQMNSFAGNMLQVESGEGAPMLLMSNQANRSLTEEQISKIKSKTEIITLKIDTIEKFGGGSIRCMLAEIFLSTKK